MNKKVLSFLMMFCILASNTSNVNATTSTDTNGEELGINLSVVSEIFPEAYVEKEYWDLSNCKISVIDQKIVSNSKEVNNKLEEINSNPDSVKDISEKMDDDTFLYGIASASVYVKEKVELQEDGSYKCIESRLLSKEELDSEIYLNLNNSLSSRAMTENPKLDSYGKLTIRLYVYQDTVSRGVQYILSGNAYWSNYGSNNAATKGDDVMALYWGGSYDYKNYGQSIVNSSNDSLAYDFNDDIRIIDQTPNGGIVWQFPEYKMYLLTPYYAKQITVGATIFKNTLTGSGNTTGVVLKYIHTYEKHDAEAQLSVTVNGNGSYTGTLTLQGNTTIAQWPLTVSVNGLVF